MQGNPHWATFQYTTEQGGNVATEELENATHELDERTYRQEFQASFEILTAGLAYYAFDPGAECSGAGGVRRSTAIVLVARLQLQSDALDHRTAPRRLGVCVGRAGASGLEHGYCLRRISCARGAPGEAIPPAGSAGHLWRCDRGKSRSSATRTDWQIVRDFLNRHRDLYQPSYRVGSSNPAVRDRVNCVNARLRNQAGHRRLTINPQCKQLIKDFERVHWKTDPSGNTLNDIDKSDVSRTHLSDALGYMIAKEFTMYPLLDTTQPLV